MAILDILGFGQQQQPMGGLVGRLQQGSLMPQQQPTKPNTITADPTFAQSLQRLGANLMVAGGQTDNALTAFGGALNQTFTDNQAIRQANQQNALRQLQLQQAQAEMNPAQASPFGGTGYQNQILASRFQFHVAQGDDELTARQKAINDFYALNPVTGVDAEGRPYTMPRAALPVGGQASAQQPSMQGVPQSPMPAAQPDAIDQAAMNLGFVNAPSGGLLPPPSGDGMQDMSMFAQSGMPSAQRIAAPQMGGPKTQQALTEEAGKAQIGLQGKQAEQTMEKVQQLGTDINDAYSSIQSIGQIMQASREAFSTQGLPQEFKASIARTFAPNDPSIQRQLAATAQLGASRAEAIGPLLKTLVGTGAVTESERANAMKVVSSPNTSDAEIQAVVGPLLEKSRNRLRVMEAEQNNLRQGINIPKSDIAASLGIDLDTGLSIGKSSSDFLPNQPQQAPRILRYNPATGKLE